MKRVVWVVVFAAGLVVPIWLVAGLSPTKEAGSSPAAGHAVAPAAMPRDAAAAPPSTTVAQPVDFLEQPAGFIFDMPVRRGNYEFAKQVVSMFPQPWGGADVPAEKREAVIWEQLMLHYESFRRGIQPTDDEVEGLVNELLKNSKMPFTRRGDPDAYQRWVVETAHEDVPYFENQMRYLLQLSKVKDQVYQTLPVTVTEEEMQQEFLSETHHVGGEMVVFDAKPEAEAFYARVKTPKAWERMKKEGKAAVRPVSLMTLEAYIDLWQVPQEQIYAFHALEIGQVGLPMPFGTQWCVYRLLEKRVGDLKDFPAKREHHRKQLEARKRYAGLHQWIEDFKRSANLKKVTTDSQAAVAP